VSVANPLIGRVTAEVRRARVAPRTRGLALGLALLPLLAACEFTTPIRPAADKRAVAFARAEAARLKRACGSQAGYDRLKSMTFVEAARIRKADSPALKRLASLSVVRMDQPVARSRDAALGVTVCSGRFVLELPPGAERLFGGDRRLEANVEYAAQDAADGSGPVYQMRGAEPIVYRLAAVGLRVREPVLLGAPMVTAAAVEPLLPAPAPGPVAVAPALAAVETPTPVPVPVSARPEPKPSPTLSRVANTTRTAPPSAERVRTDTAKRVARVVKPERKTASRDKPAKLASSPKPVKTAMRTPASKRPKPAVASRPASVRAAPRPVRFAVERRKPRPDTIKLAKVEKRSALKTKPAPAKLAAKGKPRPAPVRLAVTKAPGTAKKIAAKPKPGITLAAVRAATKPLPVRLAARPAAAPVRLAATRVAVRPSFGCDDAGSRVERLICEDPWLARADRAMSAAFYRALDDADPYARRELLRTRAAFLAFRDRCGSARCVANAYADRIEEIRDIAADRY
jgi:hypothetical protein